VSSVIAYATNTKVWRRCSLDFDVSSRVATQVWLNPKTQTFKSETWV